MIETIPLGLWEGELFNSVEAFLFLMLILSGVIGGTSGYASIGAYGVLIVFTRIGMQTDLWLYNSLMYVIYAIIFIVMGMQVWQYINSEPGGGGAAG